MDYATAVETFFGAPGGDVATPAPVAGGRPARRLRDASEPVAMHAVWARATNEANERLGLDFLTGYVWGRAAALGEPEPAVVAAAFAVFEPGLVAALYDQGRAACSRADVLAARADATAASLEDVLVGADLGPTVAALRRGLDAADGTGRPLYSGLASLSWPASPAGQLWRACELLREHRGDAHVAACVAAGLEAVSMNVLTELWVGMPLGSYTATRGWAPERIGAAAAALGARGLVADGALTEEGRRFRDEVERRTDEASAPVVAALGDDLEDVVARLEEWSAACVAAGAFPPDVHKRAAG